MLMNSPSVSSGFLPFGHFYTKFLAYLVELWKNEKKYNSSQPILVLMVTSSSNLVEDELPTTICSNQYV